MNNSIKKTILIVAIALPIAISGCMSKEKKEAVVAVKKSVRDYCDGIAAVYWSQDIRGMRGLAGDREIEKVATFIDHDRINLKRKMRSAIKEFKFEKIRFEKSGIVIVRTVEKWTYEYVSAETGAVVEPEVVADYRLEYFCVKSPDGKKYIVDKVGVIEDDK